MSVRKEGRSKRGAKKVRPVPGKTVRRKASARKKAPKSLARSVARKETSARRATKPGALGKLNGEEARELLEILVSRHPELRAECRQLASEIAGRVDPEQLARRLHRQLKALDTDDMAARSGRRSFGYVEPEEAAQELLDTLMEPYLVELRRLIEVGLEGAARSQCYGIVLGLYRARGEETDSPLAYAPDYCENEAAYAIEILTKQSNKLFRRRWRLPDGYESRLADWGWLFR